MTLAAYAIELFFDDQADAEVRRLWHRQEQGIVRWPHYLPGSWVPHCTLAMNVTPAELSAAAGMLAGFRQIQAEVAEVGITDTETGDITALNR